MCRRLQRRRFRIICCLWRFQDYFPPPPGSKEKERTRSCCSFVFFFVNKSRRFSAVLSVTIKSAADFDNWTGLSAVSHLLAIVDWNFNNKLADICGASVNFLAELKAPADSLICALERCIYPIWSFGRILLPKLCVWRENSQLIRRKLYWNFFIFPPKPEISRFH